MPRFSELRQLQVDWNETIVPLARRRRIERIREWNAVPASIREGEDRINAVLRRLGYSTILEARESLALLQRERIIPQPSARYELTMLIAEAIAPMSDSFGVEIECFLPIGYTHAMLADAINAAGVPATAELYNHSRRNHWKIVTDGSLGDYQRGAEIVSPILNGEGGFEQLKKVCKVLNEVNATVDLRCGLHVHVNAQNRELNFFKNLLQIYSHYEPVIDAFLARTRRGSANVYCGPVEFNGRMQSAENLQDLRSAYGSTRYRKVNLESFWRHGTVEFRQHQGTTNFEKIRNWTNLCLRLVAAAGNDYQPEPGTANLDGLMALVAADASEQTYFAQRTAALGTRR